MSFWSVIPIIGGAIERYQKGKAAKEDNRHAQEMATLSQFSAEFGHGRNWFDSLVDGVNRLPRPSMVGLVILYVFLSWVNPERFAVINQGLATIPEQMWYIIGIIVSFFFGARELQLSRKSKGFEKAAEAAASIIRKKKTVSDWLDDNFPDVQVKDGVILEGLDLPKVKPIITAARNLYHAKGVPLVITSAMEGKHKRGSKHYEGAALDLRTRTLDDPKPLAKALAKALGDDYDVVLESDHLHVEFDPPSFLDEMVG